MPVPSAVLDIAKRGQHASHCERLSLDRRNRRGAWILGLLLPGLLLAAKLPADEVVSPPSATQIEHNEPSVAENAKRVKPPPTLEQKRRVVALMSLIIAGILAILLVLLLWIFWWSRRTHRLLRAPLPAANRGDELWYLKAKRHPNQTTDSPTSDSPPTPPQA